MKIMQINVTANWGSTGRIAEDISRLCMQEGWESYIAYGRYVNPCESRLIRIGNSADFYIHVFHSLLGRHGLGSRRATQTLIQEIEQIHPDIIHLHNIHGYYLNYPLLFRYLQQTDIPVVWALHDCWPITGQCSHFEFVRCSKWKTGCNNCPGKKIYPRTFVDRSTKNYRLKKSLFTSLKNLTLIPVSHWLERLIQESFLRAITTRTIRNGVNLQIFRPVTSNALRQELKLDNKFILLGLASIWGIRKGLADLLKLNELIDHSRFQLILVGLTDKQIRQLPPNVIGIRRTDNLEKLATLYSAAGIYLNPTYEDNFPTTNLEALACGTPVCTYRTGGSPEAVDDATGFIIEQGDIEGMKQAALTVWEQGKDAYREACRRRAVTCFNAKDRFAEYIRLYKEVAASSI